MADMTSYTPIVEAGIAQKNIPKNQLGILKTACDVWYGVSLDVGTSCI